MKDQQNEQKFQFPVDNLIPVATLKNFEQFRPYVHFTTLQKPIVTYFHANNVKIELALGL